MRKLPHLIVLLAVCRYRRPGPRARWTRDVRFRLGRYGCRRRQALSSSSSSRPPPFVADLEYPSEIGGGLEGVRFKPAGR